MDFTNFDQMNQMIAAASGMLSQTLLWILGGLVLGLGVCSLGGVLGQCWLEVRQPQARRSPHCFARANVSVTKVQAAPQALPASL
jgi:hypothetical protein